MNKQNAEETKLETRFCISTDSPCALCHRRHIRTVGTTETYLAGTNDWVCYDCARGIDRELAEFAYYPER